MADLVVQDLHQTTAPPKRKQKVLDRDDCSASRLKRSETKAVSCNDHSVHKMVRLMGFIMHEPEKVKSRQGVLALAELQND